MPIKFDLLARSGALPPTDADADADMQDVELDDVDQLPGPLQVVEERREDARPEPRLRHARFTGSVLNNHLEALQGVVRLEGHVAAARAQDAVDRGDHGRVPLQQ